MSGSGPPITVCGFLPYPLNTVPGQRFRIEQWLPYLKAVGISVDLFSFADDQLMQFLYKPGRWIAKGTALTRAFLRSAARVKAARRYDVVLVYRSIGIAGPALLERTLAFFRCPIVFDFDDAIYRLHTSDANRWFGWLKFPGKTAAICRLSTQITVGNAHLADYARQYNPNVTVVPTSVDTDQYRHFGRNGSKRRLVVGWTGSSTSQYYLEQFAPTLRELVARRDIELRVISNREPVLPGIPHTWRTWSSETEAEEVGGFDIGIMPLADDPWARGKCALKALQYMAAGTPTICSPVGANCEVIRHGENGLLATTSEEWLNQLGSLIDDPALRRRLGEAGRETVEQKYSMRSCAELFAQVIRRAVQTR
jgi:glycosyltransferase involved in cell wall biosynthesis